jgi:hypothetical protein
MATFISGILATVVTVPFIGFGIIYYLTNKITEDKKRAVKFAADGSTILFITSVHFIAYEIWGQSFLWLILIFILITAILMALLQRNVYEDIHIVKLFRGIWRLNFLLFVLFYIVLFTYGLTAKIISTLA